MRLTELGVAKRPRRVATGLLLTSLTWADARNCNQAWIKAPESPFALALEMLAFVTQAAAVKVSVLADLLAKPGSFAVPAVARGRASG